MKTHKIAFFFPGQGAQYAGMAKDFYDAHTSVRELFAEVSEIVKKDLVYLLFKADEKELIKTENTQIAVTLTNLSALYALKEKEIHPSLVAGFSLGEYTALVAAGVIAIGDVFQLVMLRGKIMDDITVKLNTQLKSEGEVGMTAVIGLPPTTVEKILQEIQVPNVYIAMYNSPIQAVIAGTKRKREHVARILQKEGAKRCIPLKVSGPFHTPFMKEAKEQFDSAIKHIAFSDPIIQFFCNVNGTMLNTGEEIRTMCLEQIITPVRWITEETMVLAQNPSCILEVGPGNVLCGLWRAFLRLNGIKTPQCISAGTVEQISVLHESYFVL